MTNPTAQAILALFDAGGTPRSLVAAGFNRDQVYRVLRTERPNRPRAPKTCTSKKPALILELFDAGVSPARIAELCECSPAYVYRHLQRASKSS